MRTPLVATWLLLCACWLSYAGCAEGTSADHISVVGQGGDSAASDSAETNPDGSVDVQEAAKDVSYDSQDSQDGRSDGAGVGDASLLDSDGSAGAIGDSGGWGGDAGDASKEGGDGSSGRGGAGGQGGSSGAAGTGGAAGAGGTAGAGGEVAYSHKIEIDGKNDFLPSETFPSSSSANGYVGYVSWDSENLYLGMSGDDVASGVANKWVLIYLGGTPGSPSGQTYNTQTPSLPFSAHWHMRWRADNGLTSMQVYTSAWGETSPAWDFTEDVYQKDRFVEFRIPRSDIGDPTTVSLVMCMVNEQWPEWTYAAVPSTSSTDGYNPVFAKYYEFDFHSSKQPTDYLPKP